MIIKRERKIPTSFKLAPSMIEEIDAIANEVKANRTEVVEAAIKFFVHHIQQEPKKKKK